MKKSAKYDFVLLSGTGSATTRLEILLLLSGEENMLSKKHPNDQYSSTTIRIALHTQHVSKE